MSDAEKKSRLPKVRSTAGLLSALADAHGNLGFIAKGTREALVSRMASEPGAQNQIRDDVERLRVKLLGTASSPLEDILVDRVVITWLQVQNADYTYGKRKGDLSLAQLEQVQKWQDRAQRRFLQAAKALAQVRKLEIHLQVNIAEKQIVMNSPSVAQAFEKTE